MTGYREDSKNRPSQGRIGKEYYLWVFLHSLTP